MVYGVRGTILLSKTNSEDAAITENRQKHKRKITIDLIKIKIIESLRRESY